MRFRQTETGAVGSATGERLRLHAGAPIVLALALLCVPGRTGDAAPATSSLAVSAKKATLNFAQLRERGRQAYLAGRFDEARELWSAAAALKPEDADTVADLAVAFQRLNATDYAIQANRDAIRLASAKGYADDRARRIRRAAYFNLGKLRAGRELLFNEDNDGPSSCTKLASHGACAHPMFVCGRNETTGGAHGGFDDTTARFALERNLARIVNGTEIAPGLGGEVGASPENTRDQTGAPSYDVTLALSSESREPMPGEADVTVARDEGSCAVVHVDACTRRIGLYCEWRSWARGVTAKPISKAVELTFVRGESETPQ